MKKINTNLLSLILFSISVLFPIYFGFKGVLPIDSFLIFNSGYNILNDFHPFKDYWSITGPLLDYIQFVFFKIFGINWVSYTAHSAFINLILSFFSFYFFKKLGLSKLLSFCAAIGISILAYPQTGTPFMDHHAFFFFFILICFLILVVKFDKKKYWLISPFFLFLSFFSKQIPSAYIGIFLIFFLILYFFLKKDKLANILYYLFSVFFSISLFIFILYFNEIPFKNFINQYLFYPIDIGNERYVNFKFDLKNTVFQFKFIYFSVIPYFFSFIYFFRKINKEDKKNEILIFSLIIGLFVIFIYAQLMTLNQVLIFFIIPFFLVFSKLYSQNYDQKNLVFFYIILIFLISLTKYHIRFNIDKKFMELSGVDFEISEDAILLDKKLSGIRWITPKFKYNPKKEIELLLTSKKHLEKQDENYILITDYQFLPAIMNLKTISPNKWYDGQSIPEKNNKYFKNYLNFFIKKLNAQNIKYVYLLDKDKSYLEIIFEDKSCLDFEVINDLLIQANIKECNLNK